MIRHLHITKMGKIAKTDYRFDRFNVICGVNESGKSTLVEALKVAYYGFPAKKASQYKYGASSIQFEWSTDRESDSLVERVLTDSKQISRIIGMRKNGEEDWVPAVSLENGARSDLAPKEISLPVQRELFELLFCIDENRLNLFRKEEWNTASGVFLDSVSGGVINRLDEIRRSIQEENKTLYSTRSNSKSEINALLAERRTVEESLRLQDEHETEYRCLEADCVGLEEEIAVVTEKYVAERENLAHLKKMQPDYLRTLQYRKLQERVVETAPGEEIVLISRCKEYFKKSDEKRNEMLRLEKEWGALPPVQAVDETLAKAKKTLPFQRKQYLDYLKGESEKKTQAEERLKLEEVLIGLPKISGRARLDEAEGIARQYQSKHRLGIEVLFILISVALVVAGLVLRADLLNLLAIFTSICSILLFVLHGQNKRRLMQQFGKAMDDPEMASFVDSADSLFFERARASLTYMKRYHALSEENLEPENDPYEEWGGFDAYCEMCEEAYDGLVENERLLEKKARMDVERMEGENDLRSLDTVYEAVLRRVITLANQGWDEPSGHYATDEVRVAKINEGIRVLERNLQIKERMSELEREGRIDLVLEEGMDDFSLALERAEEDCQTYNDRIVELKGMLAEKRGFLTNLSYDSTLEGRKDFLDAKIDKLRMNGKRLQFFEHLLEENVRVYREAHQPVFAKRISAYLSFVVGEEIKILVDTSDGFSYELMRSGEVISHLDALSTGFMQQLALCSRLALMDVVDPVKQLPVILDDSFAFWDDGRRQNAFALMERLDRVIFYATCSAQRLPSHWNIINMLL